MHPVTLNSSQPILAAPPTNYAYPQQTSTAPASSSPLVCFKPLARFIAAFILILSIFFNINILINHIILTNKIHYFWFCFFPFSNNKLVMKMMEHMQMVLFNHINNIQEEQYKQFIHELLQVN